MVSGKAVIYRLVDVCARVSVSEFDVDGDSVPIILLYEFGINGPYSPSP